MYYETFLERIQDFPRLVLHKIKYHGKKVYRGFRWIPKLYSTHIYDSSFLYDIMIFALEDLQEFWSNPKNIHIIEASRKRNLKNIIILKTVLKKIRDEDYVFEDTMFDNEDSTGHVSIPCKIGIYGEPTMYQWVPIYKDLGHEERQRKKTERQYKRRKALEKHYYDTVDKIMRIHSKRFWD